MSLLGSHSSLFRGSVRAVSSRPVLSVSACPTGLSGTLCLFCLPHVNSREGVVDCGPSGTRRGQVEKVRTVYELLRTLTGFPKCPV